MAKTKRMFMGGAAKAALQSVKSAPKTGPAPQMPPRGTPAQPPRGTPAMPPRAPAQPPRAIPVPRGMLPKGLKNAVVGFPGGEGGKTMYSNDPASTRTYATKPPPGVTPAPAQPVGRTTGAMGALLHAGRTGGMGMKKGGKVSAPSRAKAAAPKAQTKPKGKTKGRKT
jgi:hypothetical protein